ncbi:MAG: lipoyl synthase [Nitrospinae bacterium]|nr:lipoyl synthase [Nitrospinota bacterium]
MSVPGNPQSNVALVKKPAWLRKKIGFSAVGALKGELRQKHLHTVCESAKCPNIGECFSHGTATFLILGNACTRTCAFCAVDKGATAMPDPHEPENVAAMSARLNLRHVVITSVTRDDLPDGGALHYVRTVEAVRAKLPGAVVELLIPDFDGNTAALDAVLSIRPEILNHNVETVPSLYPRVRPQADFARSLDVLRRAAGCGIIAKSGMMAGLGETDDELVNAMERLKDTGVKIFTLGQYLAPSRRHAPVVEYKEEAWFENMARAARSIGIEKVMAGPFVRSSYLAEKAGAL